MPVYTGDERYMVCPCVLPGEPNACMDKDCLAQGECLDLKYGGATVQAIAAANLAAAGAPKEEPVRIHGAAEKPHKCPRDGDPCQMLSCKEGAECYAIKKAGGEVKPMFNADGTRGAGWTSAAAHSHGHTTTYTKDCHIGMVSIGKVGGAELFLGKEWDAKKWDQTEDGQIGMIIGLLGDPYPQGPAVGVNMAGQKFDGMDKLMYENPPVPNIWIKWPDYGIVPFKRDWWHQLMNILDNVNGPVLIYCMGGHGRTGTCAAIIATLGGLVPEDECPVAWLRSVYCEKVVESESQLAYIEAITGRKVTSGVSKHWGMVVQSHSAPSKAPAGSALVPWDKSEKKKYPSRSSRGGQGSSGGGNGHNKGRNGTAEPQKLGIKKWKQWWRRQNMAAYPHLRGITRPKDLPDGQIFQMGKRAWQWNKDEHTFIEFKFKGPKPEAEAEQPNVEIYPYKDKEGAPPANVAIENGTWVCEDCNSQACKTAGLCMKKEM